MRVEAKEGDGGRGDGVSGYLWRSGLLAEEEVVAEVAEVADGHQQTVAEVRGNGGEERNARRLIVLEARHNDRWKRLDALLGSTGEDPLHCEEKLLVSWHEDAGYVGW